MPSPQGRPPRLAATFLLGAAVAVLVPLALFVLGLARGRTDLVTAAGVWWGVDLVLLLAIPASLEARLASATGREARAVGHAVRFLEAVLAALLPACLLVAVLPTSTDRSTLALLCLAGFVVTAFGAWSLRRRFVVGAGSLLFAGLLAAAFLPETTARVLARVERWDTSPRRVEVAVDDLDRGRVAFFDAGAPVLWYHLRDDGSYEWFDRPGLHPVYNVPLAPATPEAVRAFEADLRANPKGRRRRTPPAEGGRARVAAAGGTLALRSEPSTRRGHRLAQMPDGAAVRVEACLEAVDEVNGASGRWCRVTYDGTTGWAFDAFLAAR